MASLRQLYVQLSLRAETFNNGLREARRQTQEFQRTIQPTQRLLEEMGAGMKKAGMALTVGLTAPIAAVAGLGLQFNAMQEQAQIAFTTMLGDGKKARDFLGELKDFAAKTPFEFPDLVRASQRLLAMGFAADKVRPLLTSVGDAAAGLGGSAETIDRVTLALGQMQGRGRIATQEMNQLTEAGIPAWRMLAEGMGVAESKLRDMVEKGLVPAGPAVDILQRGMDKAFGGMMAKQAETFSGLLSTIKDDARFIAGDLTTGLFDLIKGPLKSMVEMLEGMRGTIAGLSSETKGWITLFGGGLALAGPALLGVSFAINSIVSAWASAKTAYIGISGALKSAEIGAKLAGGAFTGFSAAISVVAIAAATLAIIAMADAVWELWKAEENLKLARAQEATSAHKAVEDLRKYGIVIEEQGKHLSEVQAAIAMYGQSLTQIVKLEGAAREAAIKGMAPRVAAAQEIARLTTRLEETRRRIEQVSISYPHGDEVVALNQYVVELQHSLSVATSEAKRLEPAVKAIAPAPGNGGPADLSKEVEHLRERFMDALKPADALSADLEKLKKLGFDNSAIIAVYGEQILKASDAQREHGEATSGLIARLEPLAYAQEHAAQAAKEAAKAAEYQNRQEWEAVKDAQDAWEKKFKLLNHHLPKMSLQLLDTRVQAEALLKAEAAIASVGRIGAAPAFGVPTFNETPLTSQTIMGIQKTRQAAEDLEATIAELGGQGYKSGAIMAALGAEIERAAKASDEYGFAIGPLVQQLDEQVKKQKELEAATKAAEKEAERWEQTWSQVMANIVTEFARGIADVIFKARSLTSAMAGIGKSAGRAFIEAFFAELFNPLTTMLASWGKRLANTLQSTVFPKLAGAIGLGSLFPRIAGAAAGPSAGMLIGPHGNLGGLLEAGGGAAGIAGGAGGGAAAGAGGAGAAGGSSSIVAFATNPITIAVAAAIGGALLAKHFIGRGREQADKFVQGTQNPFNAQLSTILSQFDSARSAGALTLGDAQSYRSQVMDLIRGFNSQAAEFAAQGKNQAKVVEQAMATMRSGFGEGFRNILDPINESIKTLTRNGGAGLPQTGLAISASTLFSDAVDRLVPALDKLAASPRGNPVNATFSQTVNVTVAGDGASDDIRRKVVPEITSILNTGLDGVREKWTKIFRDDGGVVTA